MNNTRSVRGSAMIYVMIVMMVLSIMLTVTLNITDYERRVTKSYREYANLNDLAISGVQMAEAIFNNELARWINDILLTIAADINTFEIGSEAEYINSGANVYDGSFFLDKSIFANVFAQNADNVVIKGLEENLDFDDKSLYIEYNFDVHNDSYRVEIEIMPDKTTTPYIYNLISTASKLSNGAVSTVSARISFTGINTNDENNVVLIPNFIWDNPPFWANNTINQNYYDSEFYLPALAFPYEWEKYNPVLVIMETGNFTVDISSFYEEEKALPTVIICLGGGDLHLTVGNPLHNTFKGVIYTAGNIFVGEDLGIVVEGSMTALGEIWLSDDSLTVSSCEMLFEPVFSDEILRRKIYDFFMATAFHKGGSTFNAKIVGGSCIVKNLGDFKYQLMNAFTVY